MKPLYYWCQEKVNQRPGDERGLLERDEALPEEELDRELLLLELDEEDLGTDKVLTEPRLLERLAVDPAEDEPERELG